MTKSYLIIIAFALILAFVIGFQVLNKSNKNQKPQTPALSEPVTQTPDLKPQINNEGPVTVTVIPRKSTNANTLDFGIILETHSVELNEDLMKAAILTVDNKGYEPIVWDGDPPGGHHREGILKFGPLSPMPKKIELIISGIGGISERKFLWIILP